MDCGNARITLEIGDVERQEIGNSMHFHDGHKPRVMHLDTGHRVRQDQLSPMDMHVGHLRRKVIESLDYFSRRSVSAIDSPKPFADTGRVQPRQNSTRFWGA